MWSSTGQVIGKIRTSKLNGLDRLLGLFFGVMRACLLVVLFYIMVSWIIPEDKQPKTFAESKYYQLAGSFAKPLEDMIPEETLQLIKEKTQSLTKEEKEAKKKEEQKAKEDEALVLFEKLAQPKIKKIIKEKAQTISEDEGYKESERNDLNRLIDSVE